MEAQQSILPICAARCATLGCSTCAALSPAAKAELARLARVRRFRAGESVLAEAQESGFVGSVISGVLRLQKTLPDGRQQIVGLLLAPEMFGRVFAPVSHVAVEAATDATLCCYSRQSFERLFDRFPELEHRMLAALSHELDAAHDWMLLLATQTVAERVATFLMILHKKNASKAPPSSHVASLVEVPIARRDMAAYLGTTVESICRSLQQMARAGVIRIIDPQRFDILDHDGLRVLAGREAEEFAGRGTRLLRAG